MAVLNAGSKSYRFALALMVITGFLCGSLGRVAAPAIGSESDGTSATATAPVAEEAEVSTAVSALEKPLPEDLADLRFIEDHVAAVVERGLPATVSIVAGRAHGSGVIVSDDGYVLTAAHVAGTPGREVQFRFANGRIVRGVVLGVNRDSDGAMAKINEPGPWPHVEISDQLLPPIGSWCVAIGHPGGFQLDRPPPIRLGRVIDADEFLIRTDSTLTGGDSGGPLFDLEGRVIGIHSRISESTSKNYHVPTQSYLDTWQRLEDGDDWGGPVRPDGPYLGVEGHRVEGGLLVTRVLTGLPAYDAGVRRDDVIVEFAGKPLAGFIQLRSLISLRSAGDQVELAVRRGEKIERFKVTLGTRG